MRKIYALLLALVATVALQAQTQDNAMYVYRNDGGFNAFLREDIDSITLSHFDLDSIQHNEPVCQAFFTPDSIYRIPIEAIDSVSFVQPETKFAPGVVHINDWLQYFSHLDENRLAISFLPTLPYTVNKGDVLLFTDDEDERLPDGFAGKVSSVERGDCITFVCDSVGIDDIFENLVVIGKFAAVEDDDDAEVKANTPRKIDIDTGVAKTVKIPFGLDEEEKKGDIKLKLKLGGDVSATMKVAVVLKIVKDEPLYANVQVRGKMGISLQALLEAEGTWQLPKEENFSKYLSKAFINIPIPYTMNAVRFKMRAAPLCKITGKAKLEAEAHADVEASIGVIHKNGETSFTPSCKASAGYSASFGLEGDMFAGIRLYPCLTGVGEFFTLGVNMDVGPKLHGQFLLQGEVNKTNGNVELSEGIYDRLKDTKAELESGVTLSAEAKFKVFKKEYGKTSGSLDIFLPISEYYLLPEFTQPQVEKNSDGRSVVASSTPSRDLLMPVKLGMGLVDTDGNLIETQYYSDNYWQEKDWPSNALWGKFDNLKSGMSYKVMPYLKILGMEMKASPSKEFKFEGQQVDITDFNVTSSQHQQNGFTYNGSTYSYKFNTSVTLTLKDSEGVEDWGYVYRDPNGKDALISLSAFGTAYTDTRYVYYRNSAESTCTLFGYVKYQGDNEYYFDEPQTFQLKHKDGEACVDANHVHKVDLGLSVKWACCNVGASSPEQYGGYYAWGETSEKSSYTNENCLTYGKNMGDIAGTQYDVAHVKWGGSWRMPTLAEIEELVHNCSWQWTIVNGVSGQKVTGPNGNSIFLPAAGYRLGTSLDLAGYGGYFWSSTPGEDGSGRAYDMYFGSGGYYWYDYYWRYGGFSVRPVSE